jgi:hypothetical protein
LRFDLSFHPDENGVNIAENTVTCDMINNIKTSKILRTGSRNVGSYDPRERENINIGVRCYLWVKLKNRKTGKKKSGWIRRKKILCRRKNLRKRVNIGEESTQGVNVDIALQGVKYPFPRLSVRKSSDPCR